MNLSFYSAAAGANSQQAKMDIIGNNISNSSTFGFKAKKAAFTDLLYDAAQGLGQNEQMNTGSGMRLEKADTDFTIGSFTETGEPYSYAIGGPGFFGLYNPETEQITYTRNGAFNLSWKDDKFYLAAEGGKYVIDSNQNPIEVENEDDKLDIGVFDFIQKNGMMNSGGNEFTPVGKNGQVYTIKDPVVNKGVLEASNVDLAEEFGNVIESQKAYSYALKMLQTSDEIEGIYNNLR